MIQKATAYKTDDGTFHQTVGAAQQHALMKIIGAAASSDLPAVADALISAADGVIKILKLRERKVRAGKPTKAKKARTEIAQSIRKHIKGAEVSDDGKVTLPKIGGAE